MKNSDPVMCEHANECPSFCRCPGDCYCKSNTCKPTCLKFVSNKPAETSAPTLRTLHIPIIDGDDAVDARVSRLVNKARDASVDAPPCSNCGAPDDKAAFMSIHLGLIRERDRLRTDLALAQRRADDEAVRAAESALASEQADRALDVAALQRDLKTTIEAAEFNNRRYLQVCDVMRERGSTADAALAKAEERHKTEAALYVVQCEAEIFSHNTTRALLAKAEEEIARLREQANHIADERDRNIADRIASQAKLAAANEEIARLRQDIDDTTERMAKAHADGGTRLAAANEEIARLNDKLRKVEQTVEDVRIDKAAVVRFKDGYKAALGRAVAALQVCARVARYERRLCTRRDAVMGDCIEWRKHTPTHELCNHCEESNAVLPILADADSHAAGEAWAAQQTLCERADEWLRNTENNDSDQPLMKAVLAWRDALAAVDARRGGGG